MIIKLASVSMTRTFGLLKFERDDYAGSGIALRGAKAADVLEMILPRPAR